MLLHLSDLIHQCTHSNDTHQGHTLHTQVFLTDLSAFLCHYHIVLAHSHLSTSLLTITEEQYGHEWHHCSPVDYRVDEEKDATIGLQLALSSHGVDQGLVDLRAVDDDADYSSEDVA